MPQLVQHYEKKYAGEAIATSPVSNVRSTAFPANRFEAGARFFASAFSGHDILEIGAGDGRIAHALMQRGVQFDSYTLTEFSEARLEGLRRSFSDERFRVIRLDAENIPDEESSRRYDGILMIAVIEHLVDPIRSLTAIGQMLRPNGILYIDTPNIAKLTRRARLLAGQFPSTASKHEGLTTYEGLPADLHDEGHLHYFTYSSLTRILLERCGFSSVKRLGYHCGTPLVGRFAGTILARAWPAGFSELAVMARR